jgi:hypothetical protein
LTPKKTKDKGSKTGKTATVKGLSKTHNKDTGHLFGRPVLEAQIANFFGPDFSSLSQNS